MSANTLTRKTARIGDDVAITLKNGNMVGGTLTGWGRQIIEIAPDEETREQGYTWKRHSFPVVGVARVERVIEDPDYPPLTDPLEEYLANPCPHGNGKNYCRRCDI